MGTGLGGSGILVGEPGEGEMGELNYHREGQEREYMHDKAAYMRQCLLCRRPMGDYSEYGDGNGKGDDVVISGVKKANGLRSYSGLSTSMGKVVRESQPLVSGVIVSPLFLCECPLSPNFLCTVRKHAFCQGNFF